MFGEKTVRGEQLSNSKYLFYGFAVVIGLLFAVGISGWTVLTSQSRSFERLAAAGDVELLLDTARLAELTFTRDETEASVQQARTASEEVIKRTEDLRDLVADQSRKERLDKVIAAVEDYRASFDEYVELRHKTQVAVEAMVNAAIRASNSADSIQNIQKKYVRLDTESVRKLRQQMEEISENAANSYEIIISLESARDHEKNFLLTQNVRELEEARREISSIGEILQKLKHRIQDQYSIDLLKQIETDKRAYAAALDAIEPMVQLGMRLSLESEELLRLDRAAFKLSDTALALRSNERSVLTEIQNRVADTQELLARRLALSEEVSQILVDVLDARQSDRDFSLATTDEARGVHADRVNVLLAGVINRAVKVEGLLIEEDEKQAFKAVVPSIEAYRDNFAQAVQAALGASRTGREMVDAALEADQLLEVAKASRLEDIKAAEQWRAVFLPIGIFFGVAIILLAFLMLKSQRTLVEMAEMLRDSRDKAETATKAKASFLATMSHEIRTPMNGVVGMIDLLTQTPLNQDQRQMVSTVRDSALALLTIINDILDFSKIEAGKLAMERIPISVVDVVDGVAETLGPNAGKKKIQLVSYCDPKIPPQVYGDQVRLRQILFNLLGNAVKFTERGRVTIRADLVETVSAKAAKVRYSIEDQGVGMTDAQVSKLFEPFHQADAATTRQFGGTGLGLTIVRRLVDLMDGAVEVESAPGQGSCFTVTISHDIVEDVAREVIRNLDGVRVLSLVPDDEIRRLLLKDYLEPQGAAVDIVHDPDKLVETAREAIARGKPYDVVTLGFDYDDEQKRTLREAFKNDEQLKRMRFVVGRPTIEVETSLELPDTTIVPATPLTRHNLVNAVAVSVGRASPNVRYGGEAEKLSERDAPSVEDAIANNELIIVVEDNKTNQDVIRRQLNLLGYQCEIVEDGEEGLRAIQSGRYAIALSDVHMPNMDGLEMTQRVREGEKPGGARIPIIAITANALQGEAERCLEAGMDDYLHKPLEMKKLKELLNRWLPHVLANGGMRSKGVSEDAKAETTLNPTPVREAVDSEDDPQSLPINISALTEIFGEDREGIGEVLTEFVHSAWDIVAEVEVAVENRSSGEIKSAGHKLKSSARAVGAIELSDLCAILEKASKENDWDTIDNAFPKLRPAMKDVAAYIESY